MEILPVSLFTILSSMLAGFLVGFFYLRKLEVSSKEVLYHVLVTGEAFIIMLFLSASVTRDTVLGTHMFGVALLWSIFTLLCAIGAKGGER